MTSVHCISRLLVAVSASSLCFSVHAGQGLAAPKAEAWWPQWQARLSVAGTPLLSTALAGQPGWSQGSLPTSQSTQGARAVALLGDYYFAQPAIGRFRASGGLILGSASGVPLAVAAAPLGPSAGASWGIAAASPGSQPGWSSLNGYSALAGQQRLETTDPAPYVGLGYSGSWWSESLSLSADLGLVSDRPAAAGNGNRALLGHQGMSQALRELRVSPVLQLGVRYSF